MSSIDIEATKEQAEKAKLLPEPKGYRILCAVPQVEEEYEGGIIKAEDTKKVEEQTTVVLFVIKMGDLCYADKDRFPTGPWCKEGDFVLQMDCSIYYRNHVFWSHHQWSSHRTHDTPQP